MSTAPHTASAAATSPAVEAALKAAPRAWPAAQATPASTPARWGKRKPGEEAATPAAVLEAAPNADSTATLMDEPQTSDVRALAALPDETVQLAQLSPTPASAGTAAAPAAASTSAASASAAPAAPSSTLGIMTPANSVIPSSNALLGAAPLGAVATGGLLIALAAGGNGGGKSGSTTDTTTPTLLSAATSADGSKVVLTYSEALSSGTPDKSAFVVTADGTALTISSAARGSNTHTLELTLANAITSLKTVQLSYTAPAQVNGLDVTTPVKDSAGNRASNVTAQAVTVNDGVAPTFGSAAAYTSADSSHVVLTYSEAMQAGHIPAARDFTVSMDTPTTVANPVIAVEVVGNQVRLTLQNKIVPGYSNVRVAYTAPVSDAAATNAALQDLTGNDAAAISPPRLIEHHFDSAAPTATSAAINTAGTTISLALSETLDINQTAPLSAYAVQLNEAGSIRSVPVASVSVAGSVVTLTLAERVTTSSASVQVSYTDPAGNAALQDTAGNRVPSISLQPVVNQVDSTAPSLTLSSFNNSKTLALTFNEALEALSAPASAFTVLTGGAANPVTEVKVSGNTLELTLTQAVTAGQSVTWSYSAPTASNASTNAAVQDLVGNDLAGVATQTVDTSAPTFVSAATGTTGTQIVLTLSEAMQASSYPAGTAFQVIGSQSGVRAVSAVSASGNLVTLTLTSALLPTESVSLSYAAPSASIGTANLALQDLAGNDLASLGATLPQAVANKIAPLLTSQSLAVDTTGHLNQVVLGFNESLAGSTAPATAFTVLAGGLSQAVSSVDVSGSTVTLHLTNSLSTTASVAVSYAVPTSNPLADSDGNSAAAFTGANLGQIYAGTTGNDTLTGSTGVDYFIASAGLDTLTGGGGKDYLVWPTLATPSGITTTLKDFGLKVAAGTLQGSAEADVLDLRAFLSGYQASQKASFLQFTQDANGKLALNIDHDGGAVFQTEATVLFDNISVNTSAQLLVNGSLITATATGLSGYLTLSNVQAQWEADNQLRVL